MLSKTFKVTLAVFILKGLSLSISNLVQESFRV